MEYGLIKDATLAELGRALRAKGFVPATRNDIIAFDYQLYKTDNTMSDTNPTPVRPHSSSQTLEFNVSIPEATKLRFDFKVCTLSNGSTTDRGGQVYIWDSANKIVEGSLFEVVTDKAKGEYYTHKYSVEVESNVATLKINRTVVSGTAPLFAVLVEAYPLDVDGNIIPGLFKREAEVTNTLKPSEMPGVIFNSIPSPPEEAFKLSGDISYMFKGGGFDWFITQHGDYRITTEALTNLEQAFSRINVIEIPFTLNVENADNLKNCFEGSSILTVSPRIRGSFKMNTSFTLEDLIKGCSNLRDVEDLFEPSMLEDFNTIKVTSAYSPPRPAKLRDCISVRQVPSWWYKFRLNEESTAFPSSTYSLYPYCFSGCAVLDEITNIPVWRCQAAQTSNMFSSTFSNCYRVKEVTFETDEFGQPFEAKWKSQTLELHSYIGVAGSTTSITNYNSGITADKEVKDDATYQALKNDPDWFTQETSYSRYNHDSAVNTINSLPDTSAYLATAGGTNTIKFNRAHGQYTDGGAVQNLTAEEIAVAAAKGWTVTLS